MTSDPIENALIKPPTTYKEACALAMWAHGECSYAELRAAVCGAGAFTRTLPKSSKERHQLGALLNSLVGYIFDHPDNPASLVPREEISTRARALSVRLLANDVKVKRS